MFKFFYFIKYFNKLANYMLIVIFSVLMSYAIVFNTFYFSSIIYNSIDESKAIVLIPLSQNDNEIKRDLVFKTLSLNSNIDYIKEMPKADILELFPQDFNKSIISKEDLPQIFHIFTKNNIDIDFINIRRKINDIYEDILIIKNNKHNEKDINKYLFISFVFFIICQFLLLFSINISIKRKIKLILLLRTLGASDSLVLVNIYLQYGIVILSGFILGIFSGVLFLETIREQSIYQNNFIEILSIFCIFNIILLISYIFYKYKKIPEYLI